MSSVYDQILLPSNQVRNYFCKDSFGNIYPSSFTGCPGAESFELVTISPLFAQANSSLFSAFSVNSQTIGYIRTPTGLIESSGVVITSQNAPPEIPPPSPEIPKLYAISILSLAQDLQLQQMLIDKKLKLIKSSVLVDRLPSNLPQLKTYLFVADQAKVPFSSTEKKQYSASSLVLNRPFKPTKQKFVLLEYPGLTKVIDEDGLINRYEEYFVVPIRQRDNEAPYGDPGSGAFFYSERDFALSSNQSLFSLCSQSFSSFASMISCPSPYVSTFFKTFSDSYSQRFGYCTKFNVYVFQGQTGSINSENSQDSLKSFLITSQTPPSSIFGNSPTPSFSFNGISLFSYLKNQFLQYAFRNSSLTIVRSTITTTPVVGSSNPFASSLTKTTYSNSPGLQSIIGDFSGNINPPINQQFSSPQSDFKLLSGLSVETTQGGNKNFSEYFFIPS